MLEYQFSPLSVCCCDSLVNIPFRPLQELAYDPRLICALKSITVVGAEVPLSIDCYQPVTKHGRDIKTGPLWEDIWLLWWLQGTRWPCQCFFGTALHFKMLPFNFSSFPLPFIQGSPASKSDSPAFSGSYLFG